MMMLVLLEGAAIACVVLGIVLVIWLIAADIDWQRSHQED